MTRMEIKPCEVLPLYGRLISWGFIPAPTREHEVFTMLGRSGDAVLHANCIITGEKLMVYGYSQGAMAAIRKEQAGDAERFPQSGTPTAELFAKELTNGGHSM